MKNIDEFINSTICFLNSSLMLFCFSCGCKWWAWIQVSWYPFFNVILYLQNLSNSLHHFYYYIHYLNVSGLKVYVFKLLNSNLWSVSLNQIRLKKKLFSWDKATNFYHYISIMYYNGVELSIFTNVTVVKILVT